MLREGAHCLGDNGFAPTGTECRVQWFWKEDVSLRWPESRTKSHVRSTWRASSENGLRMSALHVKLNCSPKSDKLYHCNLEIWKEISIINLIIQSKKVSVRKRLTVLVENFAHDDWWEFRFLEKCTRKPEGKEIRKELYGERNTDTAQATCAL